MRISSVSDSIAARRPREISPWAVWAPLLCAIVVLALAPVMGMTSFVQSLAIEMMTFSILALSLDILLGYTGLVSFGHAAFFAISGYAVAIISVRWSTDLALTFPLGVAVAALLAVPIGWLSIRLSGFYFLMITFALAQMVYTAAFRWKWLTGGSDGILVPGPSLFGHPVLLSRAALYYFTLMVFFVTCVLIYWIVRSQFGRVLVGIRESTRRMRALGYNVRRYKLAAFVIAALFGGVAGVLNAQFNLFVAPESAHWSQSALVLVMVLIGGSGYFLGPIIGTIIVLGLQHWLSSYTEYWGLVLGILFIALITGAREGIVGIAVGLWRWKRGRSMTETSIIKTTDVVLRVDAVSMLFGNFQALKNVSLSVKSGERRAVIGPNGAGKSTLFNAIAGQCQPTVGRIYLNGQETTRFRPDQMWTYGLTRTFQRNQLFSGLTVWANVELACAAHLQTVLGLTRTPASAMDAAVADLLARVHLTPLAGAEVKNLAYGEQRQLELALALAGKPKILLLDEPTAGMSPAETGAMLALMAALPRDITLLIVEHDMDVVFTLADSVSVLHLGEILALGTPEEIQRNEQVREVYMGGQGRG